MERIDAKGILQLITEEDIIEIMEELGAFLLRKNNTELVFSSICHDSNSPKLYYYTESKSFHCYVCGETWSIFDFLCKMLCIEFKDSFKYLCEFKGIKNVYKRKYGFGKSIAVNDELDFLKLHVYKANKQQIDLPSYNAKVLNNFAYLIHESWYEEGLTDEETLEEFSIRYDVENDYQLIPHFSPTGNLCGIIRRTFNESELEYGCKYLPFTFYDTIYKYNKRYNLYGYWQNKEKIKKLKKCYIFEAEKSVLHMGCFYGSKNNNALALGGSTFSTVQRDLIVDLEVDEVYFCLDKQYQMDLINSNDKEEETVKAKEEYNKWITNIIKIYNLLKNWCNVYLVADFEDILEYKDSPVDRGKEVWETMIKDNCWLIEDEEELEELKVKC